MIGTHLIDSMLVIISLIDDTLYYQHGEMTATMENCWVKGATAEKSCFIPNTEKHTRCNFVSIEQITLISPENEKIDRVYEGKIFQLHR